MLNLYEPNGKPKQKKKKQIKKIENEAMDAQSQLTAHNLCNKH